MRSILLAIFSSISFLYGNFDATIPVLHLPDYYADDKRDEFLLKLEEASRDVGFFALTGTGVDTELLDTAYSQMAEYFAQDFDTKMQLNIPNGQRGYVPGESAKGEARIDFKEFYHIGRDLPDAALQRLSMEKNIWPKDPCGFQPAMERLYSALDECKDVLSNAYSEILGVDVNAMTEEGKSLLRAIHYPANPPEDAIWAGAHTDINLFTILPRSTARGLQVRNQEGKWIDVIVPDGAFVINCADMLENLTNGYFRSSLHRVVDPGNREERFSAVFFVHPRSQDRLDPIHAFIEKTGGVRNYANVNRIELLAERIIDLGLASHDLMSFFVNSGAIDRLKEVGRFSKDAEIHLKEAGFLF